MRALGIAALILAGQIGVSNSLTAAQVTLAWDASNDQTVVGYNLYYGGSTQNYTNIISSGPSTSVTVSNLAAGSTYYFAATAINEAGLESAFSTEVVYQVGSAQGTITLGNLAQTYDGTAKAVSVTTTPTGLAVAVTYNGSTSAPISSGTYQVVATIKDMNYAGSATNTLIISKGTAGAQFAGTAQTYDGTSKSVTVMTMPAGLSVALTYNGSTALPVNAGSYQVVATIHDPNYTGGSSTSLVVSKASASLQVAGLNQVFNSTAKSVAITTSPTGLPVSVTYNGLATLPINAGTYQVMATINDPNYTGSASNLLMVSKANATVLLTGLSQTYDGSSKGVGATTSPAGLSVGLTYNSNTTPPINAGTYQVVATINDSNYTGSSSSSLIVSKATASLQLTGLSQTYDDTSKAVGVITSPAGLSANVTYNGVATLPINAGIYQVDATVNDLNYSGSASNVLVVSKANASLQLTGLSQTYDGTPKIVAVTTSPVGMPVNLTYNGNATPPINAGSYQVIATVGDSNCTGSASNLLVVSKAAAGLQLGGLNQVYDGTNKIVVVTTTPAGLNFSLTYNGVTTPPKDSGLYQVVAVVSDSNFNGATTNMLNICKATASVVFSGLSQVYSGGAKAVSAITIPGGLSVSLAYPGLTSPPVNAGSYPVVATVADSNYAGNGSNTLVIAKAKATVLLSNLSQSYDGTPRTVTATTVPQGLTVTLTYNSQSTAPYRVGSYTVVGTIADGNYAGSVTNLLTISKTKGRPAAAKPAVEAPVPQALLIAPVLPKQPTVSLRWTPITGTVMILQSSNLGTWTTLTHVNGADGSVIVPVESEAQFFIGNVVGQETNTSIRLSIERH